MTLHFTRHLPTGVCANDVICCRCRDVRVSGGKGASLAVMSALIQDESPEKVRETLVIEGRLSCQKLKQDQTKLTNLIYIFQAIAVFEDNLS